MPRWRGRGRRRRPARPRLGPDPQSRLSCQAILAQQDLNHGNPATPSTTPRKTIDGPRRSFSTPETTGLSAENGDRIIEIGCVELVNRKLTGNNLHFCTSTPSATATRTRCACTASPTSSCATSPNCRSGRGDPEYPQGAEIIIHNAAFDVGFLNKELERVGGRRLATHVDSITTPWPWPRRCSRQAQQPG